MDAEFQAALDELRDGKQRMEQALLARFSSPSRAEAEAFAEVFGGLSDERRRAIMEQMVESAESSFELDFSDLFRHALKDPEPEVRRLAVEGLWEDERPGLIKPLLQLLRSDPEVGVRAAAALALGRFIYLGEVEELDGKRAAEIRRALEAVWANGAEDVEVRRRAVEALAFINDDAVRRIIDRAFEDDDPRLRESALFAMGRSADRFWSETVLGELQSPSPAMRYEAARAAGEIELRRAVTQLIKMLDDADHEVRTMAVWALGQIGGRRAQDVLERLIEANDEELSAAAEEALDELQLATRSLDMLIAEPDAYGMTEEDVSALRMEIGNEDEDEEEEDADEWPEDPLDLG